MIDVRLNSGIRQTDLRVRSAATPQILLVEDSPGEAELFCEALLRAWLVIKPEVQTPWPRVEVWLDAMDALYWLRALIGPNSGRLPAFIVLDLDLPGNASLIFLRELRHDAHLKHIPIVAMAWSENESLAQSLHHLDVSAYVIKPLRFAELIALVERICRNFLTVPSAGQGQAPNRSTYG